MCDTTNLIQKAQAGDRDARDRLVEENMGLIWSIVRRFNGRGHEMEDLFQIGSIGLIKAIDKFDFSFDVKFSTYAVPMITGEIKRFLRDDGMIKVSRSIKETALKAKNAKELWSKKFGREPSIEELSEEIGITSEELAIAMESGAEVESLYKTIYQGDGNSIFLIDKIEQCVNSSDDDILNRLVLWDLINQLDTKEKEVIIMRYFGEKTQAQIGKIMGISQVQVSRLEKKILKEMRLKME